MAQPAIVPDVLDPTLVSRAQRYERDAVASLCDRSLDTLYRVCHALTGEPADAERLASGALLKALDGLAGFDGDGAAFHVWLLRLAATAAAKRRPQGTGVRAALAQLSNFDYELVALRILGEVDIDHLSPALSAQPASLRAWMVTALREVDGRSGTGWGPDLRAFDGAVDEVTDGADPEQAASALSAPSDARALLRAVRELRALVGDPVPRPVATRLRTTMLAAAAERRAIWVHRNHGVATVPGIERRHYPTRTGTFVALGIAGLLAVVVGAVLAVLSSFAGPTSSFYPLKRSAESALLAVDLDPVDRSQLEVKLAQTREREAEDTATRGDGDRTVDALASRYQLLIAADRDLLSVSVHDSRWKAARDKVFRESDLQMTSIEQDLRASGQSRSAQDVDRLVVSFNTERRPLETQLGRPPAQPVNNQGGGTVPTPPPPT
ncbi:MAG TPA: sigma factor [Candidatus Eisenbacteria bacterium]|nr:sigma factor [Candidatus Eisenbacteria bacterium]